MAQQWPSDLPQTPLLDGYKETPQEGSISFQPAVGPPKRRKRSSAVGANIEASFLMTDTQYDSFLTFYEATLQQGSDAITWINWRTGATATYYMMGYDPELNVGHQNGELLHKVHTTLYRFP